MERRAGSKELNRFFDGAAKAAFPVYVADRPGAAWIHHGEPKVVFDFTIDDGKVKRIHLRAESTILAKVQFRRGAERVE